MALNLAKRPFVDTRPANALTAALVVVVLVLSVVSWRTFRSYLEGSHGTQSAIAELRREIAADEARRKSGEAVLARFDVEELGFATEDANEIARRRAFSWTRFLTRLERALPPNVRVVSISLGRPGEGAAKTLRVTSRAGASEGFPVELQLVSRDPLGLPATIRALYGSEYFDLPLPHNDQGQESGSPEGRRLAIGVIYKDHPSLASPEGPPAAPAPRKERPAKVASAKGAAR